MVTTLSADDVDNAPSLEEPRPRVAWHREPTTAGPGASEQLTIQELVRSCGAETSKFQRNERSDDTFGYELFRRALCSLDARAWEAVISQYRGLVGAWLTRHPVWRTVGGETDEWIFRAFERFWSALTPERFASFPSLAALLRYLKVCVHSVLLDECRALHMGQGASRAEEEPATDQSDPERTVVSSVACEELWTIIAAEAKDEVERLVAYLCLAREMKPRDVYAHHPERFSGVEEVYTVKRNLLDRLRRNPAIRGFLR